MSKKAVLLLGAMILVIFSMVGCRKSRDGQSEEANFSCTTVIEVKTVYSITVIFETTLVHRLAISDAVTIIISTRLKLSTTIVTYTYTLTPALEALKVETSEASYRLSSGSSKPLTLNDAKGSGFF
jgi:hypothetical protein